MRPKPKSKIISKKGWIYEHRLILLILLFFFVIVSAYSFIGYRVPILDEGIYIGMGKSMFSGGESGFWERFRPLGMPIITGAGWSLGFEPYAFSRLVAILFATASILLIYLIAEKLFDKKIALISALLLLITPLFFYYSEYVLTDIPSTFFILVAIYALLHNKYFLAGLMGGLGFLFKFTQGLFFIVLFIFLAIHFFKENKKDKKRISFRNKALKTIRRGAGLTLGFVLVLVPYMLFNYALYHPTTPNLYDSTLGPIVSATIFQNNQYQNLPVNTFGDIIYNWLYYLINLFASSEFLCILYLFFFVGMYFLFREKLHKKSEHLLLLIMLLTYLVYFTIIPYKQLRFVYFFVPITAIYSAYALSRTYDWMALKGRKMKIAFVSIILFLALFSIVEDAAFYSWKYSSKPVIVTDFYEYFETNNIQGTIATGDMVLAVYTDNKLTNLYELRAHIEGKNPMEINAIFHADYTYPCLDNTCVKDRTEFFEKLNKNYTLVKEDVCYSGKCYIYLKKINNT